MNSRAPAIVISRVRLKHSLLSSDLQAQIGLDRLRFTALVRCQFYREDLFDCRARRPEEV